MPELLTPISKFYHRWHKLEENLREGIEILDFDYCACEEIIEPPFSNRLEALIHLNELRSQLANLDPGSLCNADFLTQKLSGADAFLRALMGERIPFNRYLRATMGIDPETIPHSEIERMRAELERLFSEVSIPFFPGR